MGTHILKIWYGNSLVGDVVAYFFGDTVWWFTGLKCGGSVVEMCWLSCDNVVCKLCPSF